jgi:hypothetical protein
MAGARAENRNFPVHDVREAVRVAQTIRDINAGRPMNRLLLADALKIKPSSSNFRALLSSSQKYGFTIGTEKATDISLTELGEEASLSDDTVRSAALRRAVVTPSVFGRFFTAYNNAKVPGPDMLGKLLTTNFEVPAAVTDECATLLVTNGEHVGLIRAISGSKHVLMDSADTIIVPPSLGGSAELEGETPPILDEPKHPAMEEPRQTGTTADVPLIPAPAPAESQPNKPIFIGHGKNHGPLDKLTKILDRFKIPYMVAEDEPNLGRPIPVKVRETILSCGSAILIFTKDEQLTNAKGEEIWRPSENVVHELGAVSFQYEDRVVIFKEEGINLPTNFSSVGYISFEEGGIQSKTAELLGELIGFGLVKVTPV